MRRIAAAIAVGFLFLVQSAYGIWFRSNSLEWWTNICDGAEVAEVTGVTEMELANEATKTAPSRLYWRSQTVTCQVSSTLKGRHRAAFTFRQDYERNQHEPATDDRPLRPKDKLLLFVVEKPRNRDSNIISWVNLTRPDVVESQHAAYNNDCKWLGNADSILKAVRSRIQRERQGAKAKRRGLIVDFTAAPHRDLCWEFIRTADPECKPGLVKQLQTSQFPDDREMAMYNLISYPDRDTIKLILPFLRDPTKKRLNEASDAAGKPISTAEAFQLRQSAYFALLLLGARPQKPEGFSSEWHSWHAMTGFESLTYFPYGDWQRQEVP